MRPRFHPRNGYLGARRQLRLVVVSGVALGALQGPVSARAPDELPAEYLPPGHPSWQDVEALWNRGALGALPVFTRPLARADLAAALGESLDERPELAELAAARRLARELAFELARLDAKSEFRETRPPLEVVEEEGVLRFQLESVLSASFSDGDGEIPPGNAASVAIRAYLPQRVFGLVDVGVEKIVGDNPLGDAIVKGSDWYLNTGNAYVSVRTDPVDLAAGLLRHRWGPGTTGTLLLSDAAITYPALFFAKTFGGSGRFVALTAALHHPEKRWFSAHRLEFGIGESLRFALHESAAYGATRNADGEVEDTSGGFNLLYVIGLIPYSIVQRILDRTADGPVRPHRNNVMMGGDFVWRIGGGFRIDGELLVDDLTTESSSQPHRLGFQGGASWAGSLFGSSADARAEFAKVYRYTYSVFYGANFLHDGVPLGYGDGPDVERYTLFVERDFGLDLRAGVGVDLRRKGEGEPGDFWDPNDPQSQHAASVLSGNVETTLFPHLRARGSWRDVISVGARLGPERVENLDHRDVGPETRIHGEVDARIQW